MIYIALIPGVSKLIDSVISKRQGNQRKHSFLEQSTRQFHNFFSYLKMFRIQCRKNIAAEDNKKIMNIAYFINIYTNICIPILYVTRMTQNKNNLINSILQHGRVVDNNCCVVFPTSRFPYLILCPR